MGKFVFSQLSLSRLVGVNANLVKVVNRALELSDIDFMVVQGLRSREECMINWGKGRGVADCIKFGIPASYSKPTEKRVTALANPFNSKHAKGNAVDLAPLLPNGQPDWNDLSKYRKLAGFMKQASKELNVPIVWGGDWKTLKDNPHFEV